MSKKKPEQEIEEAQQKFRGEDKKKEASDKKREKAEEPQKEKAKETKTVEDAFLETEEVGVAKKPREIIDLEAITRKEPTPPPAEARDDYVEQLKTRPVTEIYNEIKDIYRAVEEKGYFSPTEERKVEYIRS